MVYNFCLVQLPDCDERKRHASYLQIYSSVESALDWVKKRKPAWSNWCMDEFYVPFIKQSIVLIKLRIHSEHLWFLLVSNRFLKMTSQMFETLLHRKIIVNKTQIPLVTNINKLRETTFDISIIRIPFFLWNNVYSVPIFSDLSDFTFQLSSSANFIVQLHSSSITWLSPEFRRNLWEKWVAHIPLLIGMVKRPQIWCAAYWQF